MNNELLAVFDYLESERGIDRATLVALVEDALLVAARKVVGGYENLRVRIDPKNGDIQALAKLLVVDEVAQPDKEIALREARRKHPEAELGQELDIEVTPANFGRIAAQTAKQAIMHKLRQAEKSRICSEYQDMLFQLVNGVVRRVERGEIWIDFTKAEGVMRYSEKIPGEDYQPGDHITALLVEVNADRPGPSLLVSRSHPDLVTRLFEREVTEITEKLVEIKATAREPGYRTKIAVHSKEERIDPVGACVGLRGNRVKTIVRELGGEKVDIVKWDADIATFVTNALQPAKLSAVEVDEKEHTVRVTVPDDQLSLAIGKKGQNARLAAKLTNWRIDINKHVKPETSMDFEDKVQRATDALARIPGIGKAAAPLLVANGFLSLEGIVAAEVEDIAAIEGLDAKRAAEIMEAAKLQLGM